MVDFVMLVRRVHLNVLEVKTPLGVLNYPTVAAVLRYHEQTMIRGTQRICSSQYLFYSENFAGWELRFRLFSWEVKS